MLDKLRVADSDVLQLTDKSNCVLLEWFIVCNASCPLLSFPRGPQYAATHGADGRFVEGRSVSCVERWISGYEGELISVGMGTGIWEIIFHQLDRVEATGVNSSAKRGLWCGRAFKATDALSRGYNNILGDEHGRIQTH